jgi:hypothetical protein
MKVKSEEEEEDVFVGVIFGFAKYPLSGTSTSYFEI